jgi:hypothetical protein
MALPRSGQLGLSQINSELGRTATSTLSLDGAENGLYGTINGNSRSRPSSANPAAISEWYSYDHDAGGGGGGGGLTLIQLGYSGRAEGSRIGEAEACSQFSSDQIPTYYDEEGGNWFNVPIFVNSAGSVYAIAGWYSDQPYAGGFTVRYWRGSSWSSSAALCTL